MRPQVVCALWVMSYLGLWKTKWIRDMTKGKEIDPITITFFCLFVFSRAAPIAYGGSQARGQIQAVASGLYHSHSNAGSEPWLQPTPQLMATPDPQPTEKCQGLNPQPHGS